MKNKKFNYFTIVIYVLIIAALVVFVTSGNESVNKKPDELKTTDFYQLVREGLPDSYDDFANGFENSKIAAVQVTEETLYGLYVPNGESESSEDFSKKLEKFKKGKTYDFSVTVQSAEAFQKEMASLIAGKYPNSGLIADNITVLDYGFYCQLNPTPQVSWILVLLPYLIIGGVLLAFIFFMNRANNKQGMNFGKSRAKTADELGNNVTFEDVAGADEEKQELREIVDFLRNPKAFTEMGARIPKGVLLVGPPGTGKTLLAKAVAGEAKVPFFSISSSEFVELYVGVGASRVRDLFHTAKRCAPAIIFIDEIDAVGRARGKNVGFSSNDERENTLNQLLTEMDGFGTNSGVIVLAATNRADILDKALLRAGRFDRQIHVELPELKEREEIFKVHIKDLKLSTDFDVDFMAKHTPGFSGADIANVCNEAALTAARKNKPAIDKQDFLDAVDRIVGGLERKSSIITNTEKKSIAHHEAGHAAVSWLLPYANPLFKVTLIPRGQALGAAWYLPEERKLWTKSQMVDEMCALIGGRVAEEIVNGEPSTGAQNDLEKLTQMAYGMVKYYGMSDNVGALSYYDSTGARGYDLTKPYSEHTAEMIDDEVRKIVKMIHDRTYKILSDHKEGFLQMAVLLLEKEVIFAEDVEKILGPKAKPADETENEIETTETENS